ncbi:MAG: group 1 truncated hemoglobin [Woeseia sp.]
MRSAEKGRYEAGRAKRYVITGVVLMLTACTNQATAPDRLYSELGGEPGITRIVEELIRNIADDPRIRHHFTSLHIAGFRDRLETHFCQITGGPCTFDGRSMRESHRLLDISEADFNALVEDLIDAMDGLDIDHGTQNRFLARLAPMQPDIVSSDTLRTR